MGIMGKIVGGTIGFALGGPLGAIAGAAFGHAFDKTNEHGHGEGMTRLSQGEEDQFTFFIAAFSMLAKLAKADGRVAKEEIDSIESFMASDLNLNVESRGHAISIFNAAVESTDTFQDFALQFYHRFQTQPRLLELMIDILIRVSVADGIFSESEEALILTAVKIFNFSDEQYGKLKSQYIRDIDRYYAVLGSSRRDSYDQIKKKYRKLVMDYHPDTIASKGLPEEFTKFANGKFREIQEAYEVVTKEKGVN